MKERNFCITEYSTSSAQIPFRVPINPSDNDPIAPFSGYDIAKVFSLLVSNTERHK